MRRAPYRRRLMVWGAALRFAVVLGGAFGASVGAVMLKPPLAGERCSVSLAAWWMASR